MDWLYLYLLYAEAKWLTHIITEIYYQVGEIAKYSFYLQLTDLQLGQLNLLSSTILSNEKNTFILITLSFIRSL